MMQLISAEDATQLSGVGRQIQFFLRATVQLRVSEYKNIVELVQQRVPPSLTQLQHWPMWIRSL